MDITTIMITAMFTGIGVSIGNAFYEFILKDYLHKMFDKKKHIQTKLYEIVKKDLDKVNKNESINREGEADS